MGNGRQFLESGGFSAYLYEDHPNYSTKIVNGIRGKVIRLKTDPQGDHAGLPTYANTSDMYFRVNHTQEVIQGRYYADRTLCIDFDWGHEHVNYGGDRKVFPKGIVHVQTYSVNANGEITRLSNQARYMSEEEINKFGGLIKAFNPNVKFRP